MSTLNEYLLKHPQEIKVMFEQLFGKHFLRYYDNTEGYRVSYTNSEETSYNDARSKRIVIAESNVVELLKMNVPALSVAYHELAHSLYTSMASKQRIIKQIEKHISELRQQGRTFGYKEYIQASMALWNVMEDERIEQLLMSEHEFLRPIVERLKTIIDSDNLIMSWRNGNQQDAPSKLVELANEFIKKRQTAKRQGEIVIEIMDTWYLQDDDVEQPQMQQHEQGDDEQGEQGESYKSIAQDIRDENPEARELDESMPRYSNFSEEENQEEAYNQAIKKFEEERTAKKEQNAIKKFEELQQELNQVQTNDQDSGIIDLLKEHKTKQLEYNDKILYDLAIEKHNGSIVKSGKKNQLRMFPKIIQAYNAKASVRSGMSMAERKSYSTNVSNRVSVERIIQTQASRKEPRVFSGKGKDLSFAQQVTIFEDISGSAQNLFNLFSSIAHGFAKSFEHHEWWLYGTKLLEKHVEDYDHVSGWVANALRLNGATSSEHLLSVMKQYKRERKDNLYVIITDGDMTGFFRDNETYEHFKDKTVVIGLLTKKIKEKMPYTFDLKDYMENLQGEERDQVRLGYDSSRPNKYVQKMTAKAIQSGIAIVQNNLR